jgi:hypothetical protein
VSPSRRARSFGLSFKERTLARAFSSVPEEDQAFWHDYQHELVSRLSKAELRDMCRLGIDLVLSIKRKGHDLHSMV